MNFKNKTAEIYVPDSKSDSEAIGRTTHMTIAAHHDDIEIMAYDGIIKCFAVEDMWHMGVVVTNGSGSPRSGHYAQYTDEEMCRVRKTEQKKAAFVGEYGALALLNYPSSSVKDPSDSEITEDIKALILAAKPEVIYTHNLADKHDTHVATAVKVITALREISDIYIPSALYGCEVWRSLDWVNDEDKVFFDVDSHPNIANSLVSLFDSQIAGGKRYDSATMGRRLSNATFSSSHSTDTSSALSYAMDLTPLIMNPVLSIDEYISNYIKSFEEKVIMTIRKFSN